MAIAPPKHAMRGYVEGSLNQFAFLYWDLMAGVYNHSFNKQEADEVS
jgi:hypothetical protein